jgi:hypothetical protein
MANGIQIFQGQTTDATSVAFWVSTPTSYRQPNSIPLLGIYGTIGNCTLQLQWKAPDGNWYDCNEPGLEPVAIGLYKLPVCGEVPLRLNYTAKGGSDISAFVYDGQWKPNTT